VRSPTGLEMSVAVEAGDTCSGVSKLSRLSLGGPSMKLGCEKDVCFKKWSVQMQAVGQFAFVCKGGVLFSNYSLEDPASRLRS